MLVPGSAAIAVPVAEKRRLTRELRRLYEKSLERFQPFAACLPSRADPAGITDRTVIEERVARFVAERARGPG